MTYIFLQLYLFNCYKTSFYINHQQNPKHFISSSSSSAMTTSRSKPKPLNQEEPLMDTAAAGHHHYHHHHHHQKPARPEIHCLRTNSSLSSNNTNNSVSEIGVKKPSKLLLNVTIERSLGAVQVVMSPDNTVDELIRSVLEIYVKEKRRPLLSTTDPKCYELHFSQFSLESLNPKEKLVNLGSRNFFLCPVRTTNTSNSSCSDEVKNSSKSSFVLTKFMDFLL